MLRSRILTLVAPLACMLACVALSQTRGAVAFAGVPMAMPAHLPVNRGRWLTDEVTQVPPAARQLFAYHGVAECKDDDTVTFGHNSTNCGRMCGGSCSKFRNNAPGFIHVRCTAVVWANSAGGAKPNGPIHKYCKKTCGECGEPHAPARQMQAAARPNSNTAR